MAIPKYGKAYTFPVALVNNAAPAEFRVNPTIAAGDFQISKDFGTFVNLANVPTVAPASSIQVKVVLTATEMQAETIMIRAKDVAGNEWQEQVFRIDVPRQTSDDIYDLMENNAVTTNNPPGYQTGSKRVDVYEDDGTTIKSSIVLSPDGLKRFKL